MINTKIIEFSNWLVDNAEMVDIKILMERREPVISHLMEWGITEKDWFSAVTWTYERMLGMSEKSVVKESLGEMKARRAILVSHRRWLENEIDQVNVSIGEINQTLNELSKRDK